MVTVIAVAALAGLFAAVPALAGAGRATGGVAGNALILTACWLALLWLTCLLFSAPVMIISGGRPVEAARLLALLLFDNPGFALACTLLAMVALLLTFGLLPGPFGLALFATNAVRLRFRRYQDASAGRPDWAKLLADERADLARRRPLSVIFPWRA